MSLNDQPLPCNKPKLGTYLIDRTLGKGIFSVVRLGTHTITGIKVAIKIIDKSRLDSENLMKIRRESEILKKLHHPNIIRLFQVMETTRLLCMVMEYLPNGEVFDYIAVHGKFSESEAQPKFKEVLSAVNYAHNCGVVHRDLKAENLLFDAQMNIKIIDFSFGTRFGALNAPELLTTWCGSPPYAAPEIFQGEPYIGTKADIWSLGVVLYVMVCGTLPFDAQPLPQLKRQVLSATFRVPYWLSHTCENLLRGMLKKEPAKRPTAQELIQHPWFYSSVSTDSNNCSSSKLRCISYSGPSTPQTVFSQLYPCVPIQSTTSVNEKTLSTGTPKRCATSMVTTPDRHFNLAADFEIGKFNDLIILIMESYGLHRSQIVDSLSRSTYDHLTATYLLLGEKLNQQTSRSPCALLPILHYVPTNSDVDHEIKNHNETPFCAVSSSANAAKGYPAKCSRDDSAVDFKCSLSQLDLGESPPKPHHSTDWSAVAPEELFARVDLLGGDDVVSMTDEEHLLPFTKDLEIGHLGTAAGHVNALRNPNLDDESSLHELMEDECLSHQPATWIYTTLTTETGPATTPAFVLETRNEEPAIRRGLARRKYGIHVPAIALDDLTRSLLTGQVNLDQQTDPDSFMDSAT